MPIPNKRKDEDSKKFVARCMSDPVMKKDYKDSEQRVAVCLQGSRVTAMEGADLAYQFADAKWDDEWDEFTYEFTLAGGVFYEDDRDKTLNGPNGISEKDKGSKDSKDSKVTLNKPFRTPEGPKKFSVYVKNDKGNVVKVNFGSPEKDMDIKRDDPERKKSFRARFNCDEQKDRTSPAYWSCKFWSNTKVSDLV
jgi:hypothetical protein